MSSTVLATSLKKSDPQIYELVQQEKQRQIKSLELIPSENFTSVSVLECLGSCLTNKYSEGLPGARYYGGNEYIDKVERLCQSRALEAFGLNPDEWGVNVQPYSGSPANFAVYTALVGPHGRIMGLDLPDGGHLTHGFMTSKKKISATSLYFESMPYKVDPVSGLIDYEQLAISARLFKPKIIIAGMSCYSRCLDYEKFRKICDENESYLFSDMSHVSGLVAAKVIPSPFQYSDVVSSTTHKTLRGPRAGIIFYRKGFRSATKSGGDLSEDLENKINNAVFPGLQGGPHNNAIAAIATSLLQATTKEFRTYQEQVVNNAKKLCSELQKFGFKVVTDGTDVHLFLLDLRPLKITGSKAEHILELVGIACNKNTVPGDDSSIKQSGIRCGTPALTTRGMVEDDMSMVASLINKGILIGLDAQKCSGPKLIDFKTFLNTDEGFKERIRSVKIEVEFFAEKFFMPPEIIF